LQDSYDNYGNFIETIDNSVGYGHILVNTGYNTTYFGTSYPTIVFGGFRGGMGFDQSYWYNQISTRNDYTPNQGIWVTSGEYGVGVSAGSTGNLALWDVKRVYTRTENLNTTQERKVYLVYGFDYYPQDRYGGSAPNRNNNYGYENVKYIIYVYRFVPNRIDMQTLSGYGPGGGRFVVANYAYTPVGATVNVNYPESSYSPYALNRLYSCSTVLTQNNLREDLENYSKTKNA
jgi:hypothetical protein